MIDSIGVVATDQLRPVVVIPGSKHNCVFVIFNRPTVRRIGLGEVAAYPTLTSYGDDDKVTVKFDGEGGEAIPVRMAASPKLRTGPPPITLRT
jgi:hypothetical protein